jgi:hypothetical protein
MNFQFIFEFVSFFLMSGQNKEKKGILGVFSLRERQLEFLPFFLYTRGCGEGETLKEIKKKKHA